MEKFKERREKALALTYGYMVSDMYTPWDDGDEVDFSQIERIVYEDWGGRELSSEERNEVILLIGTVEEVRDCFLRYLKQEK